MHSSGNDFCIIDFKERTDFKSLAIKLCNRKLGVGADGLIIEVHNDPANALCDGPQSLKPERFDSLMKDLNKIAPIVGKKLN